WRRPAPAPAVSALQLLVASLFRCKVKDQVRVEQGRIRGLRQRRGAIHRILDGLSHGLVAIAGAETDIGHRAAGHLPDAHLAAQPDARRGGTPPVALHGGADEVHVLPRLRAAAHGLALALGLQLRRQFRLAARQLGLFAFAPLAFGAFPRLPFTLQAFAFGPLPRLAFPLGTLARLTLPLGTLARLT